jgi:protein SCO1/2
MTRSGRTIFAFLIAVMTFATGQNALAQQPVKPGYLDGVGIDQNLGAQVPLDLSFKDETGKAVKLADYFDGSKKPVILTLIYYKCPDLQLCTLELNDLNRTMNGMSTLSAGDDYQVVTISFDPTEGPALAKDKKEIYMNSYRRPHAEQGWHFLTGDADSINKLTKAVGFKYKYDQKFQQYVHPNGLMVLTPKGQISRYFFSIDYDLKDLRLALEEASGNKIGTLTDQILLYCFHYDPTSGKYSFRIIQMMQLGGILTMGALGAFWFSMARSARQAGGNAAGSSGDGSKKVD